MTIPGRAKIEKFLLTNGVLYCIIHSVRGVERAPPKEKEIIKMTNTYFTTITALLNELADRGFPAQLFPIHDGFQLRFPWYEGGDIACHSGTFGVLESYGFPWDDGDVTRDTMDGFVQRLIPLWAEVTY